MDMSETKPLRMLAILMIYYKPSIVPRFQTLD